MSAQVTPTPSGLLSAFGQICRIIPPAERGRAIVVVFVMTVSSLVQVVGVVSIMPFLLVLANPEMITSNIHLNAVYGFFGFEDVRQFQITLGVATFAVLLISTGLRSLAFYLQHSFAQQQRLSLSARIMGGYLAQPYTFFVENADAELAKALTQETAQYIDRGLMPAATAVNNALQLVTLIAMLLLIDPIVTLVMVVFLGGSYLILYTFMQPRLLRHGEARHTAELARNHSTWEVLNGAKPIKLGGHERAFLNRFKEPTHILGQSLASAAFMQTLPRYLIEAIAFGCIVLLALTLTLQDGGPDAGDTALPMLAIYAFAGYRMMPALQQLYGALTSVRYVTPAIDRITELLAELETAGELGPDAAPMPVTRQIVLDQLTYRHVTNEGRGIEDISITLPAGSSLGLVGSSGAGKTTLIDTFLGLLTPDAGRITVDGIEVEEANRRAWQRSLGYVPQDIYLATRSVVENIAFGIDFQHIDRDKVQACAAIAQIDHVIRTELPDGYDTQIGDRGLRLSGGQRQRIGIARALYHDPAVLVFDEATNALDVVTEARVLDALQQHCSDKTIVWVAHRLSTIAACDQIAVLDQGRLTDLGTYSELRARSEVFQDLVRADDKSHLTD